MHSYFINENFAAFCFAKEKNSRSCGRRFYRLVFVFNSGAASGDVEYGATSGKWQFLISAR